MLPEASLINMFFKNVFTKMLSVYLMWHTSFLNVDDIGNYYFPIPNKWPLTYPSLIYLVLFCQLIAYIQNELL